MPLLLRISLYFSLMFLPGLLLAQPLQQYLFSNISAREGLASNHVNSMVQDDEGYMWIGTLNGLQRYDDNRYITFRHNPRNKETIADNHIIFLFLDSRKNLWVSFYNGKIGIFDRHDFKFKEAKVDITSYHALTGERQLLEDKYGNLMLVFRNYTLTSYNSLRNEFSEKHNRVKFAPPGWKITRMFFDKASNNYWISADSGLAVYNPKTRNLNYRHHNPDHIGAIESTASLGFIFSLYIDSKRRLWFSIWPAEGSRIYCFDMAANKMVVTRLSLDVQFPYYHEPRYFVESSNGMVWLYGTGLLTYFDEKRNEFYPAAADDIVKKAFVNTRLDCLFEDREQNLWVCTQGDGIYQFNPAAQLFKSFPHKNLLSGNEGNGGVMSFVEDLDGTFLYSAWGDGLFRCDSNFQHIPLNISGIPEKNDISAWDLCQRADGSIWIGGQDGRLLIYNPQTRSAREVKPTAIGRRTIRQIVEDKAGNMWLGTQNYGVAKWDPLKAAGDFEQGFSVLQTVPGTLIEKLFVDNAGDLWVCTIVDGVYKINPADGKILAHYTEQGEPGKRLLNKGVGNAFQFDDTTMIFAAGGLNILNTRTNSFTYVTSFDGLPSDIINAIEKDHNGDLWVSFLLGICRVNLRQKTFSFYDRSDGIADDKFSLAASYQLTNGNLLFGTASDFTVFNPDDFIMKTPPPDVRITGFSVSNKSLKTDSLFKLNNVDLHYSDNSITIDFSSLSYLQKNKLTYFYMMEGVDKNWIRAGVNLQAVYSHLAPGEYTFNVKCQNADGTTSKNITQLHLTVSTPFWRAWWFYTLLVLAGAVLVFLLDRERMNKKAELMKMRTDIADNLHEELSTALNNINILSEMARIKTDKEPQKSKEYIEQIHTKSNNMIVAMDDMLWSISPNNDSMKKTVERMREYIDELQNQHGVVITMLVDQKVNSLELNMKLRHESFLLFKDGIKSLVQCGMDNCEIQLRQEKNNLLLTIQFKNASCNMQQVYNLLHRTDMERHLQTIGANLDVEVHKTFSILYLRVPIS